MKVNKRKCATCPWRDASPYANLRETLHFEALSTGSRICHSTGSNAINAHTGKPEKLCRGARDEQLAFFVAIGFLGAPTDAAWRAKCADMGINADGEPI